MQDAERPTWTRRDTIIIAGLMLLTLGLRLWQLGHTEVASRNSIGYIRYAWTLHRAPFEDWPEVFAHAEQHPAYPVTVWAASVVFRPLTNEPDTLYMQHMTQLVSVIAAILLVVPLYALGRELMEWRVGLGIVLFVQCLPLTGRIFADGLSESMFLLFATAGFFGAVRGLRTNTWSWFAFCGFGGGMAYLTRPEGGLIVAGTGVVLLLSLFIRAWQRPLRETALNGSALSLSALVIGIPFVLCVGHITVKPTAGRVLKPAPTVTTPTEPISRTRGGPLLADWWYGEENPTLRVGWGGKVLLKQLMEGSFYFGWIPALWGIWVQRRLFRDPAMWVLLLVGGIIALTLWRVAIVLGYLSDRHALLILLPGGMFAVAGMLHLAEKTLAICKMSPEKARQWALVLPCLFAAAGLPKTLETLHAHRSGFREVGFWLAANTQPNDYIEDPYCWSHYYAGRVFLEGTAPPVPPGYEPRTYVVIEDADNPHPRLGAHMNQAKALAQRGELVHTWTGKRGKKTVEVRVYAVPR